MSSSIGRAAEKLVDVPALLGELGRLLPGGTTSDRHAAYLQVLPFVHAAARPGALRGALTSIYRHGWHAGVIAAKDATVRLRPADTAKADASNAGVVAAVDWNAWEPGDELAADEATGLDELLRQAVGDNPEWAARADARGEMLASIEDRHIDRLASALADALAAGDTPDTLNRVLQGVLSDTSWSDMVATTEMARAMTAATLATYARDGIPAKEYLSSKDTLVCPACSENEDLGAVPLGEQFPNGDPPAHPNCRCALLPAWIDTSDQTIADWLAGTPGTEGDA